MGRSCPRSSRAGPAKLTPTLVHSVYSQYLKSTRIGADERGVGVDLQVVGVRLRLVSFVAAASEPDTIVQMSDVIQ